MMMKTPVAMNSHFNTKFNFQPKTHRSLSPPLQILANYELLYFLSDCPDTPQWFTAEHYHRSPIFVTLNMFSEEYQHVANLFYNTSDNLRIHLIERVENPYLMYAYLLKKRQLYQRYGFINEIEMFHATKREYVLSICKNNFNWRYHGMSRGHKFGKGVSFSPRAGYAHMFSDKNNSMKVMFLVDVLMNSTCVGHEEMHLPPSGFNSSQKNTGDVIVKYEDNEFYPKYVISYYETLSIQNHNINGMFMFN